MIRAAAAVQAAVLVLACEREPADAPVPSRQAASAVHTRIQGSAFYADEARFRWLGITAFRLAEFIAHGRQPEALAYLDWAGKQGLTVVRVLTMARHLFQLNPDEGLTALPKLLDLAASHGLHVEIVAFADTADIKPDFAAHMKAVAAVAARHPNAFVEVANEPWHPTQDPRLHDPAFAHQLAVLVPAPVPVALGSIEGHDGYAAGRYATWHSPRSSAQDGWGHVLALAQGAALVDRWKKPIVSDEPIGAAARGIPGRRDDDPARFGAAAALTRLAGLGATFHYEGGLQARIPSGRELECFNAWMSGSKLLEALPEGGRFLPADSSAAIVTVPGARAVFAREYEREAWVIVVDPAAPGGEKWTAGWRQDTVSSAPGVRVIRAVR